MRRLALIACLVIGAVIVSRSLLAAQDFVIIPEPSLRGLDDYEPDIAAMTAHYTELFEGRTHREIVAMLESGGIGYYVPEANMLNFGVSKVFLSVLGSYSVSIDITFDEGMFAGVTGVESEGLLVP